MDILFIIYIFALFVIFSPNFIFKYSQSNNIYISLTHAVIFSVVIYITYNSVIKSETEGATIGSFNKNNEYYPLRVDKMNLGTINAETPTIEKKQDVTYNNDIIVSTPNTAEEQRLTAMPTYDYSNFRTYDYENMKKKINMLESHQHTNHYFDLVPNFNQTRHEVLCAADYGTNKPCCRQPDADIPKVNQCTELKPHCKGYISGVQWGKCVSTNPYPKPNLVYDGPKNKDLVGSPSGETKPTVVVEKEYITKYINNCSGVKYGEPVNLQLVDGKTKQPIPLVKLLYAGSTTPAPTELNGNDIVKIVDASDANKMLVMSNDRYLNMVETTKSDFITNLFLLKPEVDGLTVDEYQDKIKNEPIEYGDKIAIAIVTDRQQNITNNQCGWFGCRVLIPSTGYFNHGRTADKVPYTTILKGVSSPAPTPDTCSSKFMMAVGSHGNLGGSAM